MVDHDPGHASPRMLLHHMDSATPGGIGKPGCLPLARGLLLVLTHAAAFLCGVWASQG